jgi:hypothetical protein
LALSIVIAMDEEVVFVVEGSAGQVLERCRKGGTIYALRFRAYGERHYVTLGGVAEGWTRSRAEFRELESAGDLMARPEMLAA